MALTKKDTPFVSSTACKRFLERLKESFVSVPILRHFDPEKKIVVEIDASNPVIAGVLSQYDNDDILYLVAHFSRKHSQQRLIMKFMIKNFLQSPGPSRNGAPDWNASHIALRSSPITET
jgi:hypothetical protein